MEVNRLRQATSAMPFRPFTLHLADGRTILVPHPDFIAISSRTVIVVNHLDESILWIDPLLIVSIDFVNDPGISQVSGSVRNGTQTS